MKALFLFISIVFLGSCETDPKEIDNGKDNYFQVKGFAQGTTYSIIYQDSLERDLSFSVDSILNDYDTYLSTYLPKSVISRFNDTADCVYGSYYFPDSNRLFVRCFMAAKEIYYATDKAFNPAVYSLVKYWGFFKNKPHDFTIDSLIIDSLVLLADFSDETVSIEIDTLDSEIILDKVCKTNPLIKLDFNGIAQGHSVDLIGQFLESMNIDNYMVEVGGELLCKGVNNSNSLWRIGIDKPIENTTPGEEGLQLIIEVNNKAVATSGNYRKFYEKDGVKYSHTINPQTGYPVQHSLLSATVISEKCVDADGYATAFMVMGVEKTKKFILDHENLGLEVYLIASKDNGEYDIWMSKGVGELIQN